MENKDQLLALAQSDPARLMGVLTGGFLVPLITAIVENKGNVTNTVRQSACDSALAYGFGGIAVPALLTLAGPETWLFTVPYGIICETLAAICNAICNGMAPPGDTLSKLNGNVNASANSPVTTAQAQKARSNSKAGGHVTRSKEQAQNLVVKAILSRAYDIAPKTSLAAAQGLLSLDLPLYTNKATLGTGTSFVPNKVLNFVADWNERGRPMDFWTLVSLLQFRIGKDVVDALVAGISGKPPSPADVARLRAKDAALAAARTKNVAQSAACIASGGHYANGACQPGAAPAAASTPTSTTTKVVIAAVAAAAAHFAGVF